MARIFMDGFEYGRPTSLLSNSTSGNFEDMMWKVYNDNGSGNPYGTIDASTTAYSGGDYSMRFYRAQTGSFISDRYNCIYKELSSNYNKLYSRFNFRFNARGESDYVEFFALDDTTYIGGSLSCILKYHANLGNLQLYTDGTLRATVNNAFIDDTWHLVDILYDNSGSNVVIKVDNTEVINYSGTVDSAIDNLVLGRCNNASINTGYEFFIDDFAINDDSGSVNNSWIGSGVIRLIKPTSDDTNADFTPSTGSDHYAMVDDFPDDGDTTYNSSTVSGDIDTFGLESVPSVATGQTINAVQAVYRARSETDVASVAPILISGATTDTGATQSTVLSDYNDTKQKVYDVDPNTSVQWTETNVNAVKGGYKNAT